MKTKQLILSTVALAVATSFVSNSALALTADDVVCAGCVHSGDIAPKAVTTGRIDNGAVTTLKIANAAVTTAKIGKSAVTDTKIAIRSVATRHLKNGAVRNIKIDTDAVTSDKILNGTITGDDIASNSIGSVDISNETGMAFNGSYTYSFVNTTGDVVSLTNLTLVRPAAGSVTCTMTGFFRLAAADANAYLYIGPVTSATTDPGPARMLMGEFNGLSSGWYPFSSTETYTYVGAGSTTYYMNFTPFNFDGTSSRVHHTHSQCVYYPTTY